MMIQDDSILFLVHGKNYEIPFGTRVYFIDSTGSPSRGNQFDRISIRKKGDKNPLPFYVTDKECLKLLLDKLNCHSIPDWVNKIIKE